MAISQSETLFYWKWFPNALFMQISKKHTNIISGQICLGNDRVNVLEWIVGHGKQLTRTKII